MKSNVNSRTIVLCGTKVAYQNGSKACEALSEMRSGNVEDVA